MHEKKIKESKKVVQSCLNSIMKMAQSKYIESKMEQIMVFVDFFYNCMISKVEPKTMIENYYNLRMQIDSFYNYCSSFYNYCSKITAKSKIYDEYRKLKDRITSDIISYIKSYKIKKR